ncbi:hypothetical protein [Acetobacter sp.]|jgi:hypothetical protein|uniref:hypothetical protein n=1 Tax=Acetobacter sp. TaxID=440 RepID=UPI0025C26340|nr:hypothetical protein [Acetobacter sp.]MCI1301321.1 hypothetical protein [Acetobacter sp.]
MDAISHPASRTPEEEARQRFLTSLHDAGIALNSPLGLLLARLNDATAETCQSVDAAAARITAAEEAAQSSLRTMRDDLTKGLESARAISSAAELRIKAEEERLKQHQQATIDKMIASIMGGLKTELYDRLKQQMPHHEQGFYLATRWKAISRLALAGALFFCGGLVAHYALVSHTLERGRYCEGHSYVAENGQAWCDLTPLRVPDRNQN